MKNLHVFLIFILFNGFIQFYFSQSELSKILINNNSDDEVKPKQKLECKGHVYRLPGDGKLSACGECQTASNKVLKEKISNHEMQLLQQAIEIECLTATNIDQFDEIKTLQNSLSTLKTEYDSLSKLGEDQLNKIKLQDLSLTKLKVKRDILNRQLNELLNEMKIQSTSLIKFKREKDIMIKQLNAQLNEINNLTISLTNFKKEKDELEADFRSHKNYSSELIKKFDDKETDCDIRQILQDGIFVWKLDTFTKYQQNAKLKKEESIFSDHFYTHKYGYKMRLWLYPDGYGDKKGKHLSIYLQIMKGLYDDILKWPVDCVTQFSLINQLKPGNKYSTSMSKPIFTKPMTEAGKSLGFTSFTPLPDLKPFYLVDDVIFIEVNVTISNT